MKRSKSNNNTCKREDAVSGKQNGEKRRNEKRKEEKENAKNKEEKKAMKDEIEKSQKVAQSGKVEKS